ncbi:MAG: Clp protease ClpP [Alistipes sp.]|nr:Clp protease ClpP [Alistipes sp.]
MQTKITISNSSQTCFIDIEGTIGIERGDGAAGTGVATYEAFRREVERIAEVAAQRVVVNIRSTGGDVNDALLIYDALRALDAHITTRCYGYTASAATIIAQAADKGAREISSNAMYLIHRSMCAIEGNAPSLEARADLLNKTDERLAQLYALHTGTSAEVYAALMAENNGEGRWLTAQETVEMGLADRIFDSAAVEEDGESKEVTTASTPLAIATEEPLETDPLAAEPAAAAPPLPQEVKKALNVAAGELLRYLFDRFAYRWEQWMERLRERREERRAEREVSSADSGAVEESSADSGSAEEVSAEVQPSATASEVNAMVSPLAQVQAARRSRVAFDEGQRRYSATATKPVEDPSHTAPNMRANERAYSDDVKAFSR